VVFYATHARALITEVRDFYETSGLLGFGVVAVLFLGVASLSGGWALWCESKTYKAAFSAGLGLPALILSGSGAFAPAVRSAFVQPTHPIQVASLSYVPMLAAAEPGVLSRAFSLVFNPVGTVVQSQTAALEQKTEKLQQETVTLQQQSATLQKTNAVLRSEHQVVQAQLSSLEIELDVNQRAFKKAEFAATAAKTDVEKLSQQLAKAESISAAREQQIQKLDRTAKDYEEAAKGLTRQIDDTQRKLAASDGIGEFSAKEIRRLTEDQKSLKNEYDRLLTTLARMADPNAVNVLKAELRSVQNEAVKDSISKAMGAVPRATAPGRARIIP